MYTHTSVGEPYRSYYINPRENKRFLELYVDALENGIDLHLSEKHKAISPICIDVDFRQNAKERLYDEEYLNNFIGAYTSELFKLVCYNHDFTVYILEKTAPREYKNGIYKDGFHIMIPEVITCPAIQYEIRNRLLNNENKFKIEGVLNNLEDIIDEAVIERNNWLMYGSKKQDEPYVWKVSKVLKSQGREIKAIDIPTDLMDLVKTLSIRYDISDESRYTEEGIKVIKEYAKGIPRYAKQQVKTMSKQDEDIIRQLVGILDPKRADSYEDWIRVGWCLHNIDKKLLQCWIDFSQQSNKYMEGECEKLWYNMENEGLKKGSLHMWAKQDNNEEYLNIIAKHKLRENTATIKDVQLSTKLLDYTFVKGVFEKTCAKLKQPMSCYVEQHENGEFKVIQEATIKKGYRNLYYGKADEKGNIIRTKFIDTWLDDPRNKEYRCLDFLPPPMKEDKDVLNSWKGFAIDKESETIEGQGDIKEFINHAKVLVGNTDAGLDYLIKWLAHIIQEPGNLNGIALVFISDQGAGKNLFWNGFAKIIGEEYYFETSDPSKDIFGQFANGLKNKLLIDFDEAHGDVLKRMITEKKVRYEAKGVDAVVIRNFARCIFTTNNLICAKIEENDRRFVVFETSNEKVGNMEYFRNLASYFDDPKNQKAIIDYLRNIDISKVDWQNDRPKSETQGNSGISTNLAKQL